MNPYPTAQQPLDPSHGDVPTMPVSALVPIRSTAVSRPLRGLARVVIVVGLLVGLLSVVGTVVWVVTISSAVDFAKTDIRDANEAKDDTNFFDLDREADNVARVLILAGVGVGLLAFVLGMVIVVIGGVARQLDRTLAPVGHDQMGAAPMAAIAYPGVM